jgi:hypothetical protein
MDMVLEKNDMNRAAQFGGTCQAIIDEIEEHVLQAPTRVTGTDDEI